MAKPAYMSQNLYDILTVELEYQQRVMRAYYVNAELHASGEPGHDDDYRRFNDANDEARLIKQQMESIVRNV